MRHRLIRLALVLVATTACSSNAEPSNDSSTPRPVTMSEAELLSVARFNNYDRGLLPFELTVTADGDEITLIGSVDYRDHQMYASLSNHESGETALTQATISAVAFHPHRGDDLVATPPQGDWTVRPLNARQSTFDAAVLLLLQLASDRPENPLLLRQNGAQWFGESTIDGTTVDEMSGPDSDGAPSLLHYYVDDDGNLTRFTGTLGARGSAKMTVEFGKGDAEPIPLIAQLKR